MTLHHVLDYGVIMACWFFNGWMLRGVRDGRRRRRGSHTSAREALAMTWPTFDPDDPPPGWSVVTGHTKPKWWRSRWFGGAHIAVAWVTQPRGLGVLRGLWR